jgi:hypothetical protein
MLERIGRSRLTEDNFAYVYEQMVLEMLNDYYRTQRIHVR